MIEHERNNYVKDRMDFVLKTIMTVANQISTPIIGTYCIPARTVNGRSDHRPLLTDFEYDSLQRYPNNIQLLYRDEYYNPSSELFDIVEIRTVKNVLNEDFSTKVACVNGHFLNLANEKV